MIHGSVDSGVTAPPLLVSSGPGKVDEVFAAAARRQQARAAVVAAQAGFADQQPGVAPRRTRTTPETPTRRPAARAGPPGYRARNTPRTKDSIRSSPSAPARWAAASRACPARKLNDDVSRLILWTLVVRFREHVAEREAVVRHLELDVHARARLAFAVRTRGDWRDTRSAGAWRSAARSGLRPSRAS